MITSHTEAAGRASVGREFSGAGEWGTAVKPVVRQHLFEGRASNGDKLLFASLSDGRCVVFREGKAIRYGGGDTASVEALVEWFRMNAAPESAPEERRPRL